MKYILLIYSLIGISLHSCKSKTIEKPKENIAREYYSDGVIKSETEVKDTSAHGLMKNYDRDGTLISVYTFNMSKLDGPAVSYYPNGKIKLKLNYSKGKRQGITQWYYITGELYRSIPYKDGEISGTKISYYKNGKVMAEAPILDDFPGIGLKEYNPKGELLKEDNKIIVKEDNRLFAENNYILYLSLSTPKPGVKFYLGELINGKYLSNNHWELPEKDGVAYYNLNLEKGRFRMETLVFTASYKTSLSNYKILSREYNLAIDNK